jgi:hypothetical protein
MVADVRHEQHRDTKNRVSKDLDTMPLFQLVGFEPWHMSRGCNDLINRAAF